MLSGEEKLEKLQEEFLEAISEDVDKIESELKSIIAYSESYSDEYDFRDLAKEFLRDNLSHLMAEEKGVSEIKDHKNQTYCFEDLEDKNLSEQMKLHRGDK